MIVNYKFVNGDTAEVEVSDEIGNVILESRREEETAEKMARKRCWSIDALEYEGLDYAVYDSPFEDEFEDERYIRALRQACHTLMPTQKKRFMLYLQGRTVREIAAIEDTAANAIQLSLTQAKRKTKIYFSEHPVQEADFCPYGERGAGGNAKPQPFGKDESK